MVRPVWLGVAGIVLGAALLVVLTHTSLLTANQTQHDTPVSSLSIKADPKPLAKAPAEAPGTTPSGSASDSTNGGSSQLTDRTPTLTVPITKPAPVSHAQDSCNLDLKSVVNEYNREVGKKKNQLNSILSFKVGLNISSQYVDDYNNKVTGIFNKYLVKARAADCDWPVKEPPLLPSNYPL
jgi:hypothetical protein